MTTQRNPGSTLIDQSAKRGFTLIELSIVLVIIGLIVGGVLVGQDLIKGAEIRATVSQLEKYNAATNTFRGKYNGLPGDLSRAASFGFTTRTGAAGRGDGNGLLEGGEAGSTAGCGETLLFWRDLTEANFISDNIANASTADPTLPAIDVGTPSGTSCNDYTLVLTINYVIPLAKIGKANSFIVYAQNGLNYFYLSRVAAIGAVTGTGSYLFGSALTPQEAFQIDSKMDDGVAISGTVIASVGMAADAGSASPASGSGACVDTALNPDSYATATGTKNENGCQLRIRTSF